MYAPKYAQDGYEASLELKYLHFEGILGRPGDKLKKPNLMIKSFCHMFKLVLGQKSKVIMD
jgi:hypothetical protein